MPGSVAYVVYWVWLIFAGEQYDIESKCPDLVDIERENIVCGYIHQVQCPPFGSQCQIAKHIIYDTQLKVFSFNCKHNNKHNKWDKKCQTGERSKD